MLSAERLLVTTAALDALEGERAREGAQRSEAAQAARPTQVDRESESQIMPRHIPATTSDHARAAPGDRAPLVTEKGMHRSTRNNAYAFEVNRLATKDDVQRAVEELFDVKVVKVRTQNRKGKPRRTRFRRGTRKDWKKAIVTLDAEHRIDFF